MNVQELRIGNWVNMCIYDNVTPRQINSEDIDRFDWYGIERWQPIPLTEEILFKCGFSYDQKRASFTLNLNPLAWGFLSLDAGDFSFSIEDSCGEGVAGNALQGLHQLQNLYFALTGTELDYTP